MSLRGKCAIVGVGEAGIGRAPQGLIDLDLIALATSEALDEAGRGLGDVDGLFSASGHLPFAGLNVAEYLGLRPTYMDGTNTGGSSFVAHLHHAAAAIDAGLCTTALVTYGSTQLSDKQPQSSADSSPFEAPYQPRDPVTMYALAAARHMHDFGTTREQLAAVTVASRAWAAMTPDAFARDPLSVDDVLASRMVSSPLSALDCCLMTDGAAAIVVTSAERAGDGAKPPVFLLGAGEGHSHRFISEMPDLTTTAATESGKRAYTMAGLGPSEVDLAELYDAFTINVVLFLEDLGFCPKGEGGSFVADGGIAPGGRLPVNTNGGGISYCHPGMFGLFLLVEATRQLRGDAGERSVANADVALVHANGGALSSQTTAILGTEAARG